MRLMVLLIMKGSYHNREMNDKKTTHYTRVLDNVKAF